MSGAVTYEAVYSIALNAKPEVIGKTTLHSWKNGISCAHTSRPETQTLIPLTAPSRRLVAEISKKNDIPEFLTLRQAYVLIGDQEFIIYDVPRTHDQAPYNPCLFAQSESGGGLRSQLLSAAYDFGCCLPSWAHCAGCLTHKMSLTLNRSTQGRTLIVHDKISLTRFPLGEYCRALPLPGFEPETDCPKHSIVVGKLPQGESGMDLAYSSEFQHAWEIWEQIERLNQIVRSPKASNVLLTGPPGSGKEVYALAIHFGALRPARMNFQSVSVAGLPTSELRRIIFGAETSTAKFMRTRTSKLQGLIDRAASGTLFLDEFDKVSDSGFYGSLLRVLEAGVFYREGSVTEEKVSDVSWIFAGAFSTPNAAMPPDFWSRLNDHLRLGNPITIPGYAGALFLLFHFQEIVGWSRSSVDDILSKDDDYVCRVARVLLFCKDDVTSNTLVLPGEGIAFFARRFAKRVRGTTWSSSANRPDSVRAIRQAALAASRELLRAGIDCAPDSLSSFWNDESSERIRERALLEADHVLGVTRGQP